MLIGVAREFGIDRQEHRVRTLHRDLHGKFHALVRTRFGGHVLLVLLGCQDLAQDRPELHLAQDAARLDVAEHALEVAHARGDSLHIAQTLVDRLELVAHLLERRAQAIVQRARELFVNGGAHAVELLRVVGADRTELGAHGLADLVEPRLRGLAIGCELLHGLAPRVVHVARERRHLLVQIGKALLVKGRGLPLRLGLGLDLLVQLRDPLKQLALRCARIGEAPAARREQRQASGTQADRNQDEQNDNDVQGEPSRQTKMHGPSIRDRADGDLTS